MQARQSTSIRRTLAYRVQWTTFVTVLMPLGLAIGQCHRRRNVEDLFINRVQLNLDVTPKSGGPPVFFPVQRRHFTLVFGALLVFLWHLALFVNTITVQRIGSCLAAPHKAVRPPFLDINVTMTKDCHGRLSSLKNRPRMMMATTPTEVTSDSE